MNIQYYIGIVTLLLCIIYLLHSVHRTVKQMLLYAAGVLEITVADEGDRLKICSSVASNDGRKINSNKRTTLNTSVNKKRVEK